MKCNTWRSSLIAAAGSSALFLSLSWTLGLLTGCHVCVHTWDTLFTWMSAVPGTEASIVGLLFLLAFPLMISWVALRYHFHFFIYLAAFGKALVIGFCHCAVCSRFGSAGWLVSILLLFSQFCSGVLLLFFWFRALNREPASNRREFFLCGLGICSLWLLDCLVVSPFLVQLWKII